MVIFKNRQQAGGLLSKRLSKLKLDPKKSIICAIPRGGVMVADAVSQKLNLPLSVIIIKKLSAPQNPELAIGAVASHGAPVLDRWLIADLRVSADYLKKEIIKKRKEASSREKFLNTFFAKSKYQGKTVVIIDDGLATGQTAKAAAKIIKSQKVAKLILAVPCAPPSALDLVREDYDEIFYLESSKDFMAVGQFYGDFRPITEEEVKEILSKNKFRSN